jgi:hypothetical protein
MERLRVERTDDRADAELIKPQRGGLTGPSIMSLL